MKEKYFFLIVFQLLFWETKADLLSFSPPSIPDDDSVRIGTRSIGTRSTETNLSFVVPSEGYCGESQKGQCKASNINKITVEIPGFGSHSFTANSIQMVRFGAILLHLTITPDQHVPFIFTFSVDITYTLDKNFTFICSTFNDTETRQVLLQSGICTSSIQYMSVSNTLTWKKPKCRGWESAVDHYNLTVESTSGVHEEITNNSSYMIPADINGKLFTTVIAENVCGEKTELSTAYFNVEDEQEEDNYCGLTRGELIAICVGTAILLIILCFILIVYVYIYVGRIYTSNLPQKRT